MKQFKRALATAGTGAVLALSMAGVAAADANTTCEAGKALVSGNICGSEDNSTNTTTTYTVSGNCSAIIRTGHASADSDADGGNGDDGGNGIFGTGGAGGNGGDANSEANANTSVTFSPDCSTTTNVAAAPAPAAKQVVAPTGGVHAGGGAGVAASSTASIAGLVASAGSLGLGVVLRKKALLGL